jgi:GAF domain-containing protein
MVVPDAGCDQRFADNPLVTDDPGIRFYAGHPLSAPDGSKIGTVCIIDREPRHLGGDDLQALRDLGKMVEQEFAALALATIDGLTGLSNQNKRARSRARAS